MSSHEKGNGVETEGESNNYGIVDQDIQFMGSYFSEGLLFDEGEFYSSYLFRIDMFNIKNEFSGKDLFVDWLLIDQLIYVIVLFYIFFMNIKYL